MNTKIKVLGIAIIAMMVFTSCNEINDVKKLQEQKEVNESKAAVDESGGSNAMRTTTFYLDRVECAPPDGGECGPEVVIAEPRPIIEDFIDTVDNGNSSNINDYIRRNLVSLSMYINRDHLNETIGGILSVSVQENRNKKFVIFENVRTNTITSVYPFVF